MKYFYEYSKTLPTVVFSTTMAIKRKYNSKKGQVLCIRKICELLMLTLTYITPSEGTYKKAILKILSLVS